MKATVAICTYNRAYDLSESIHSAIRQHVEYDVEIIVIDNNSTDGTAQLVQEIQASEGVNNVKYVLEKKPGLSAARNRAIREARGEYILFLDDDAIASPLWIQHIVDVFESDSSIGCVGARLNLSGRARSQNGFLARTCRCIPFWIMQTMWLRCLIHRYRSVRM